MTDTIRLNLGKIGAAVTVGGSIFAAVWTTAVAHERLGRVEREAADQRIEIVELRRTLAAMSDTVIRIDENVKALKERR